MSWHQHTKPLDYSESETSPQIVHLLPESFPTDVLFPLNRFVLLSLLGTIYNRVHGHEYVAIRLQSYGLSNHST